MSVRLFRCARFAHSLLLVSCLASAPACVGTLTESAPIHVPPDPAPDAASLVDAATPGLDAAPSIDASVGTPTEGWTPRDRASVFFSGHSLININSPAFFAQLAERSGEAVAFQLQMGVGASMSVRLACPRSGQQADGSPISYDLLSELARPGRYDTLVVTERHDVLDTIIYERSTAMARRFRDAFAVGSPGGQSFLFESWYTIDVASPAPFRERAARELIAWECIASRVNASRGAMPPMLVVPAGQALSELVGDVVAGRAPGIASLRDVFLDDVHLTNLGNYFIALLHYGVVYRQAPVGLPHTGMEPLAGSAPVLTDATAAYLQDLATRYAERTFAGAASSQRSDAECEPRLLSLCETTFGRGHINCTEIIAAYRNDTAPVPVITDAWCQR